MITPFEVVRLEVWLELIEEALDDVARPIEIGAEADRRFAGALGRDVGSSATLGDEASDRAPGIGTGAASLAHGLFESLKEKGIHVATVTLAAFVSPGSKEAGEVAEHFWQLYTQPKGSWSAEVKYPAVDAVLTARERWALDRKIRMHIGAQQGISRLR